MTEDEKQFLMDLFDRHELSLEAIMCLLRSAAARMSIIAIEQNNESLHQAMTDLDIDCMRYLTEHTEE
jgi:hypothetical protein